MHYSRDKVENLCETLGAAQVLLLLSSLKQEVGDACMQASLLSHEPSALPQQLGLHEVETLSHTLISVAGSFGLNELAEHAERMEEMCKTGEDVVGALDKLQSLCSKSLIVIEQWEHELKLCD